MLNEKCAPNTGKPLKRRRSMSHTIERRQSARTMEKTAWRFAKSFSMDLTNMSEVEKPSLHPTRAVKRKIVDELDNVESSIGREDEVTPTSYDPHRDKNRDSSPITTPPHSSHDHEVVRPNSKEFVKSSKRSQINPLDSPATRTRSATRRLTTTEEVQNTREENVENVVELPTKDPKPKKTRGPTKMQTIAVEPELKLNIRFNEYGQPIGETSVGLASFLGSLVREVVPVNIETWKKLSTRHKEVLWHSIQVSRK